MSKSKLFLSSKENCAESHSTVELSDDEVSIYTKKISLPFFFLELLPYALSFSSAVCVLLHGHSFHELRDRDRLVIQFLRLVGQHLKIRFYRLVVLVLNKWILSLDLHMKAVSDCVTVTGGFLGMEEEEERTSEIQL